MQIPGVAAWLAVAVTPVVLSGQTSNAVRCDSIQYRFVDQGAPMTARRYRSIQDGQSYALRDSIVLDGRGIAEIQVWGHRVRTDTTWDVNARLTPAGASAMAAATAHNVGEALATLLGDVIVANGIIESPLGPRAAVRIGATRRAADSLAARARQVSGASCNLP